MHPFHRKHNGYSSLSTKNYSSGKHNEIRRDENGEPKIEFDERFYYTQREPQLYTQKESSKLTDKENVLKSYILGVDDSVSANEESGVDLDVSEYISCRKSQEVIDTLQKEHSPKRVLNSERATSCSPKNGNCLDFLKTSYKTQFVDKIESDFFPKESPKKYSNADPQNPKDDCTAVNILPYKADPTDELINADSLQPVLTGINTSFKLLEKTGTLNIEKEEIKNNIEISNKKTTERLQGAYELKEVISANNINVSKAWLGECFIFDKKPTSYGLIQQKVESSGLLATVNAYMIKELLFNGIKNDIENLQPNKSQLEQVLIEAMIQILWQAGGNKATLAVLVNEVMKIQTLEELIENLVHQSFISKDDLRTSLKNNIAQFVNKGSHGCILFLISVILSRGVQKVMEDMNGITALINSNGTCTLELINLLLSGTAVSNVFDNDINLQSKIIKGIPKRSEIGYLSIKEHFKYCKVGSYLKTPRFPIWLVDNENHFAILFSCQKQLLSDWKVERKFLMTYYDALKLLGKEMRLSIDNTITVDENREIDNIKATVENCVRTKWKDAYVTWK